MIPKLNSLDIIQISMYDPQYYYIRYDNRTGATTTTSKWDANTSSYEKLDYYIGYSSLFNH